ncbi:hypothetical protein [Nocardia sp. NPDC024068]|uniref:hypothetical protein n=1 Tax=Nocardia sp. NPDC024068 TaxID=3157197 RepID=UPI0033F79D0C
MPARITKLFAATTIALALGAAAAPAASAATGPMQEPLGPITGSVVLCLPLGSATICI